MTGSILRVKVVNLDPPMVEDHKGLEWLATDIGEASLGSVGFLDTRTFEFMGASNGNERGDE